MTSYLPTKNLLLTFYALAFGLVFFALHTGTTLAYFNDTETSSSSFKASSFDIFLTKTDITSRLSPAFTDEIEFSTVLLKAGDSLTPQYAVASQYQAGDMNFCQAVRLIASHGAYSYNGPLLDFVAPTSTVLGTWEFDLELDHVSTNFPNNATCDTDVVFNAWRAGLDLADSGFTDEERVNIHLTANMVVLNEFLPNPDGVAYGFDFGSDSSNMPQGEWVELYNNSDTPFDLTGWNITDGSGAPSNVILITASNTVPATTVIPGHGWLVVYMNKALFNNSGDSVVLRDNTNVITDSHTYEVADFCSQEPTPDDPNTGEDVGGGSCPDVPGNKSYARIPDGIGSWVDPIPTPGSYNLLDISDIEITANADLSIVSTSLEETTVATGTASTSTEPENNSGGGGIETVGTSTASSTINGDEVSTTTATTSSETSSDQATTTEIDTSVVASTTEDIVFAEGAMNVSPPPESTNYEIEEITDGDTPLVTEIIPPVSDEPVEVAPVIEPTSVAPPVSDTPTEVIVPTESNQEII